MSKLSTQTKFDFKDPDMWQRGVPHEKIAQIRRSTPVYWNDEVDGSGFWSVLKYQDIFDVSRNPGVFSSATANGGHRIFNENEVGLTGAGSEDVGIPFISMDPPAHQKRRMLLVPRLSSAKLKEMTARIEARAKALIEDVEADTSVEWVEAVSAPFPLMTLVELMGVSPDDWKKLYRWTNAFVGEDDPDFRASPEEMNTRMEEFGAYAAWLFETRRKDPGEDIISALANAETDGKPAGFQQFLADMILLTVGGNETIRNSISNGMIAFAESPDQWTDFCSDDSIRGNAVQEIVRHVSPVLHMRRTATEDTRIGDVAISKGDKVVLWYVAGNRDETMFEEPNRFDIRRSNTKHVGFGTGQHFCLGQRVAELQLRALFGEMANRFSGFEIAEPPTRLRSNFINGLKSLTVIPKGRK